MLFTRTEFHSGIINGMAKGAFAVYLITDYPASEQLWNGPFDLYMISMHPIQLLWVFGALIVIYLVCTVFDLIRQALFSVTIDRFWNRWFDAVWSHVARLGNMLVTKVE